MEIVNLKKSNIIVGVIYRSFPFVDLPKFNGHNVNKLWKNISEEQKSVFLFGDFDVNFLNYSEYNQTNEFLESLASNSFISLFLQTTRITSHSNTLIDNIFSVLLIHLVLYQVIWLLAFLIICLTLQQVWQYLRQ